MCGTSEAAAFPKIKSRSGKQYVSVSIEIDPKSFAVGKAGPMTGGIWMTFDGIDFPERNWIDFPVVLMSWWGTALLRILTGQSRDEDIHFMEGPFSVSVVRLPDSTELHFSAINESFERNTVAACQESMVAFRDSFMDAARKLLIRCNEIQHSSKDLSELRMVMSEIEGFQRQ